MSIIRKVTVAGASGLLGNPVVNALVEAGFTITALTRKGSKSVLPPSVKAIEVDYNDVNSLTSTLQGQDAVISTVGSAALAQQESLFKAAIAAKVKRLIPSEFGSNVSNAKARQLPVYGKKVQIQDWLKKNTQGTDSTYTFIYNNVFLDGEMDMKFVTDLQGKKMEVYDGGERIYTTTPLAMIAQGVVGVLRHPDETANRVVRLHGAGLTQKKLLAIVHRVVGKEGWKEEHIDLKTAETEAWEAFKKDPANVSAYALKMIKCAAFGDGFGGDFSQDNDNELLGLKELSEREIEEIVRSRA